VAAPAQDVEQAIAGLLAPGGPFELVEKERQGRSLRVYRNRPASLRQLLLASQGHGEAVHAVRGERRMTFAEHFAAASRLAVDLARRGVRPGDRVAILLDNRPEWLVGFWAATASGAVAVALNTWWSGDELQWGVSTAEPRVLLAERRLLQRLGAVPDGVQVVTLEDDWPDDTGPVPDLPGPEPSEDDPALLFYSSGTSGVPKGVVLDHLAVVTNVQNAMFHGLTSMLRRGETPGGGGQNVSLVTVPLFHSSGLHGSAVVGLATGTRLVFLESRFDPVEVMRVIEAERVTTWGSVPTMVQRVVDHPDVGRFDLSSVRQAGMGAAPAPVDLASKMTVVFPNAARSVSNGWGLSEATAIVTVGSGREWLDRPTAVGRPVPTNDVEARDQSNRRLGTNEVGELCVRGPIVMRGYWRDPDATAEVLDEDGWLHTGDLGYVDDDGYVHITGRTKDVVIRGGENVYPVEVERRLALHPAVVDVAVVGVPDPDLGEVVKAVVQHEPGGAPEPAELAAWVAEGLARFKVPTIWELRTEPLPRNAGGKVLKQQLR